MNDGGDDYGNFYYCHHRWYDSQIGRWISRDPSGLDGGVNTYPYCGGDPVCAADPSGLYQIYFGYHSVVGGWCHCFLVVRDNVMTSSTYGQMWCFDAGPERFNLESVTNPGKLTDYSGWYGQRKKGHQLDFQYNPINEDGSVTRERGGNAFLLERNDRPVNPELYKIDRITAKMDAVTVPYSLWCDIPLAFEGNSNSFVARILLELGYGRADDIRNRHFGEFSISMPGFMGLENDPWEQDRRNKAWQGRWRIMHD